MKSVNNSTESLALVNVYEIPPDDKKGAPASGLIISKTISFDPASGNMKLPAELTAQLPAKTLWAEIVTTFGTVGFALEIIDDSPILVHRMSPPPARKKDK